MKNKITNFISSSHERSLGIWRMGTFNLPIEVCTQASSAYTFYAYINNGWQRLEGDCRIIKSFRNETVEIVQLQHSYREQIQLQFIEDPTITIDGGFLKKQKHKFTIELSIKDPVQYLSKFAASTETELKSYFNTEALTEFKEHLVKKDYEEINFLLLQDSGLEAKVIEDRVFYVDEGLTDEEKRINEEIRMMIDHKTDTQICINTNEIDEIKTIHEIKMNELRNQSKNDSEAMKQRAKLELLTRILTLPGLSETMKIAMLQHISGEKITAIDGGGIFFDANNLLNTNEDE